MLLQYDGICGLSGSLGSNAEVLFLKNTYNAETFYSPPFLDTCRSGGKKSVELVGRSVQIYNNPNDHRQAVVDAAVDRSRNVPVLVICATRQGALDMWAAFSNHRERTVDGKTSGNTQLFLEFGEKMEKMQDGVVTKRATEPVMNGDTTVGWRITVTDLWGGRGQDYRISNTAVDDAGGILVIATTFPASEREWLQWLGRTARSDRRGQYMLMLDRSSSTLSFLMPQLLQSHPPPLVNGPLARLTAPKPPKNVTLCGDTILNELKKARDRDCKTRLDALKGQIDAGRRLNQLCDAFWKREGGVKKEAPWPANERQRILRDLLEPVQPGGFSEADVDTWSRQLGLALS